MQVGLRIGIRAFDHITDIIQVLNLRISVSIERFRTVSLTEEALHEIKMRSGLGLKPFVVTLGSEGTIVGFFTLERHRDGGEIRKIIKTLIIDGPYQSGEVGALIIDQLPNFVKEEYPCVRYLHILVRNGDEYLRDRCYKSNFVFVGVAEAVRDGRYNLDFARKI